MSTAPIYERLFLSLAVGLGLFIAVGTGYLAYRTRDFHWVNRGGAAIVALQAIVIVIEFSRRDRLQALFYQKLVRTIHRLNEIHDEESIQLKALDFLEREVRKAEGRVLLVAVLLAMAGELLHGFGDILMETLMN
jgi:hypothetical protein